MSHVDALSRYLVEAALPEEKHTLDVSVIESEEDWITTVQTADVDNLSIKFFNLFLCF